MSGTQELMDDELPDEIIEFMVKTLVSMAANVPASMKDDGETMIDDIIASTEQQLHNVTSNLNRIIAGLKEAKANAGTKLQES